MSVIPANRLPAIQFCETRGPVWQASASAIGITTEEAADLFAQAKVARGAFDQADAARAASKAATTRLDAETQTMRDQAAILVRKIKAFAESRPTPAARSAVYALAQIPEPAAPTPLPAPGRPESIGITLEPSGAVTLSWEADNAAAGTGAFFTVLRKLPTQTAFTPIGGSPGSTSQSRRMSFTDFTVPTSAAGAGAQYIIQGRRAERSGEPSDAIVVQFGVDGLGQTTMTASVGDGGQGGAGGKLRVAA